MCETVTTGLSEGIILIDSDIQCNNCEPADVWHIQQPLVSNGTIVVTRRDCMVAMHLKYSCICSIMKAASNCLVCPYNWLYHEKYTPIVTLLIDITVNAFVPGSVSQWLSVYSSSVTTVDHLHGLLEWYNLHCTLSVTVDLQWYHTVKKGIIIHSLV